MSLKRKLRKTWNFVWHNNSLLSWIVDVILAFVIVKFIIYPLIGFMLSTSFPIVAVVSTSMEHNANFDTWWNNNKDWYESKNIAYEQFKDFPFQNGFNMGDIMVLTGVEPKNIKIGDVIVYERSPGLYTPTPYPIIHRVVEIKMDSQYSFETKGDNNPNSDLPEMGYIKESQIQNTGKAVLRIPFLGWIKILATDLYTGVKNVL